MIMEHEQTLYLAQPINALVALVIALLCANSASLGAEQKSKQAVTVVVICDAAAAQKHDPRVAFDAV